MKAAKQHRKQAKRPALEDANRISNELRNIESFMAAMTLDDFARDKKAVRAVERCLEIIGDSGTQMMRYHATNPLCSDLSEQIDFEAATEIRNLISHEYFRDNAERVFNSAHELLRKLTIVETIVDEALKVHTEPSS